MLSLDDEFPRAGGTLTLLATLCLPMTHTISVLLDKAHVNGQQHQSTGGFAPFRGGLRRVQALLGPARPQIRLGRSE